MEFLSKPFIPQNKISKVILSNDCSQSIISNINKFNIEIISTQKNTDLVYGLQSHADLQIHILKNIAIAAPFCYEYYKEKLPEFNVIKGNSQVQDTYPNDIAYNVAVVNDCLYHNLKYTDKSIINLYNENRYRIQNSNQGYTKCTTCIVTENAVITEDYGTAKIMQNDGIDVLLIESGDILLNSFNYGFLGGASGLLDKNTLAFCGEIKNHRNYKEILNFTQKHKVDIISLSNNQLTDIGSIIPILI